MRIHTRHRLLAAALAGGALLAPAARAEGDASGLQGGLTVDRLELQHSTVNQANFHYWHADGWLGTDTDKLFLKSEGSHSQGAVSGNLNQLLYGHAVSQSWTLEAGGARTGAPGPAQNWLAFNAEGDLPYAIDSEWMLFLRPRLAWLRTQFESAVPLKGAWKFVPKLELNFYSSSDPANQIGSGFSDGELSLRIAYDFNKHTAGYIGYSRYQTFGNTAALLRASGTPAHDNLLIGGLMISL